MKFLVDAHLPRRLARWLQAAGHDAVHTLDLPLGNRTPDPELCAVAEREQRVMVTKDADFTDSFLLRGQPPRLLLISTGNLSNRDLLARFDRHLDPILAAFTTHAFVELDGSGVMLRA